MTVPAGSSGLGPAFSALLFVLLMTAADSASPRARSVAPPPDAIGTAAPPATAVPYPTQRTHRVGNMAFTVGNYGCLGSEGRSLLDPCTGLPAESFEFPAGSGIEHLFSGALWIGAVKNGDTLVSVGKDSWWDIRELLPEPFPEGAILTRTTRTMLPGGPLCPDVSFSEDAVSDQDFVATYTDTVTDARYVDADPVDGPHVPIGIEIRQASYAWSFDYAKDFILMDFHLRNISGEQLSKLYMGLFMDHDVGHISGSKVYADDITAFTPWVPSPAGYGYRDTVNLAWIADNDGDPAANGRFDVRSATGVTGVHVVRAPGNLQYSFNWWVSNITASQDWGPNKRDSKVIFLGGQLGTPSGDIAKYAIMANGEFDFPQWESVIDHSAEGWLPPVNNPALAVDLADGSDTRYLLSFGPFDMAPDSALPLTIAIVAGSDFHTEPRNFEQFFDPYAPEVYLERLNLTNFARNAQWAGWFYDTPGYDTDNDGFHGNFRIVGNDTIYYTGDGVPDLVGPPPPKAPGLRASVEAGAVRLRFNGEVTESAIDPFSCLRDFEGYHVYLSTTGDDPSGFTLMATRDRVDYTRYEWNVWDSNWVADAAPLTLDSLQALYDDLVDTAYHWTPFHPDSFQVPNVDLALREVSLDPVDPSKLDTNYYYFEACSSNEMPDDAALAYRVDSLGEKVYGVIRKVFPQAGPEDTLYRDDGSPYLACYEYEYAVDGLEGVHYAYFAVTPFDFGYVPMRLEPQAAPLGENMIVVAVRVRTGDVDNDEDIDVADVMTVVYYLFTRGAPPRPVLATADANCDGDVSLVDIVIMVNHVFRGAAAPVCPVP